MKNKETQKNITSTILILIIICSISLISCSSDFFINNFNDYEKENFIDSKNIPDYNGKDLQIPINNNLPYFINDLKKEDLKYSFEQYGELDNLGRCTVAYANIGIDLMPTEKRESIGMIKPTGWHTIRYDEIVEGRYLYNRCHLIGYQLTAENANRKNLITGTRYFNTDGMLPYENMVAEYIKKTGNHVFYKVTPDFRGNNMLANGVFMEAYSVEDDGKSICFNVYVYNIQPGIDIDYFDGTSRKSV